MLKSLLLSSVVPAAMLCSVELAGEATSTGGASTTEAPAALPKAPSKKQMNEAIDRLAKMHRTFCQSGEQFEQGLHEILVLAASYVKEHGDAVPADKIVKILYSDRKTQMYAFEAIAWFRKMTPVRWGASRDPMQAPVELAKGADGKPLPVNENAGETPFFKLAEVQQSRNAARAASQRTLTPFGIENVAGWVNNIADRFKNAGKPNDKGEVRGYKKGEKQKTADMIRDLKSVVAQYTGDDDPDGEPEVETKAAPTSRLIKAKAA